MQTLSSSPPAATISRTTRVRGFVVMSIGTAIAVAMVAGLAGGQALPVAALFAWVLAIGLMFIAAGAFLAFRGAMPAYVRYPLIAMLAATFLGMLAWTTTRA